MPPAATSSSSRPATRPHSPRPVQQLAARLIYWLERGLMLSLRSEMVDQTGGSIGSHQPRMIFCTWHNRLALSMLIYRKFVRPSSERRRLAAMISASKDGAFLAGVLHQFGVHAVRGSTSRRGSQALRELAARAQEDFDLAITPDGPRGPCYQVQEGIVTLAQLTGLPIIPVTYHARWKIRLRSWDRFQIPLPFSRCTVTFGSPIRVPRDLSDDERRRLKVQLEETMKAQTNDT